MADNISDSNTKTEVTQEKRVTEQTFHGVKTRKKGIFEKIVETFIVEDIRDVKEYVLSSVIIPKIQNMLCDIVSEGASMLFSGNARSTNEKHRNGSYINYSKYSYDSRDDKSRQKPVGYGPNFEEPIFDTRGDAEIALDTWCAALEEYGVLTIGDVYDTCGIHSSNWSLLNKYGWKDLRNCRINRIRIDGETMYVVSFPRPRVID